MSWVRSTWLRLHMCVYAYVVCVCVSLQECLEHTSKRARRSCLQECATHHTNRGSGPPSAEGAEAGGELHMASWPLLFRRGGAAHMSTLYFQQAACHAMEWCGSAIAQAPTPGAGSAPGVGAQHDHGRGSCVRGWNTHKRPCDGHQHVKKRRRL